MRIGIKTLLFGNHQVILHPILVTIAWAKLYSRLPNLKELVCIIIHDWGYWGTPNLDGKEGERHPIRAGRWVERWLDRWGDSCEQSYYYRDLIWYHSRFLARQHNHQPSKLCLADKLGVAMLPTWLWVFMGRLTGEIKEYRSEKKYGIFCPDNKSDYAWFEDYKHICQQWVETRDLTIRKTNVV